jgi:hypothetical protein
LQFGFLLGRKSARILRRRHVVESKRGCGWIGRSDRSKPVEMSCGELLRINTIDGWL